MYFISTGIERIRTIALEVSASLNKKITIFNSCIGNPFSCYYVADGQTDVHTQHTGWPSSIVAPLCLLDYKTKIKYLAASTVETVRYKTLDELFKFF